MSPSAGFDPGENDGYDATTSPARYRSYAGAGGSCRCETKPCFVRALVAGVLSAVAVTRSAQRGVPQPWLVGAGVVAASVLTRLVLARALHRADLAPWDAAAVVLAGGTLLIGPSVHLVPPGHRTPHRGVRLGRLKAGHGGFGYRLPAGIGPALVGLGLVRPAPHADRRRRPALTSLTVTVTVTVTGAIAIAIAIAIAPTTPG